MVKVLPML